MAESAVRFDNVSKQYRLGLTRESLPSLIGRQFRRVVSPRVRRQELNSTLWAVKDVSFELASGQCLALIGANGAGKTTILKLLARITRPTSGRITVAGRLAALIELGAGFHPDLSGRENIYLNGTILGLSRDYISRHFDEIVDFSELAPFIDTPIKRYSSGMAVRLGFSVAACVQPEILLVDEVLAVGDASFREKCLSRIQTLLKRGTSIVFVSHNLYMVQAVCHKAIWVQKGQVKYDGAVLDVIDRYEQDLHQERTQKLARGESGPERSGFAADITGVEIQGQALDASGTIESHEPAAIRIRYAAYSDLPEVNFAMFIIRSDGVTCAMMRSKLDQFTVPLRRGCGEVTLSLERLQLATGTYFVEVEITNSSDSMVLKPSPSRSAWFAVRGRGRSYDDRSGVFELTGEWAHVKLPAWNGIASIASGGSRDASAPRLQGR